MKERRSARPPPSYAGQLLLAHPALRDPNFRRTVVLLSVHTPQGAMGVVLNRPLPRQLSELSASFALGPLAGVPLYAGGPVEPQQLLLVSWQWLLAEQTVQLHFGLDPDKAAEQLGRPGVTVRGFLGYSGWGEGQLENEMKHHTWLPVPVEADALERTDGVALWRELVVEVDPAMGLQADEPDDPALN